MNGVPDFVAEAINNLPRDCQARGITYRELSELSDVDYAVIAGYSRKEKCPVRSYYNRLAKILDWRKWRKNDKGKDD